MTDDAQIDAAVTTFAREGRPERIIRYGSYACGDAGEDSDLELLVIAPRVKDRAKSMVGLRRALRPLHLPVEVLVYSSDDVVCWGDQVGRALYWARRRGNVVWPSAIPMPSRSDMGGSSKQTRSTPLGPGE
jgi:predicted nucleotidyltransferase